MLVLNTRPQKVHLIGVYQLPSGFQVIPGSSAIWYDYEGPESYVEISGRQGTMQIAPIVDVETDGFMIMSIQPTNWWLSIQIKGV